MRLNSVLRNKTLGEKSDKQIDNRGMLFSILHSPISAAPALRLFTVQCRPSRKVGNAINSIINISPISIEIRPELVLVAGFWVFVL